MKNICLILTLFILSFKCFSQNTGVGIGSMEAKSNVITVKGLIPKVGDIILVETGGEQELYGRKGGTLGTIGVGGVWPQKMYETEEELKADPYTSSGKYVWVKSTGKVYRNRVAYTQWGYYTAMANPLGLRTKVVAVKGLNQYVVETPAYVSTKEAKVYIDNWNHISNTATLPKGAYAIGAQVVKKSNLKGAGMAQTKIFSPDGFRCASILLDFPGIVLQDLTIDANGGKDGYAFAEYPAYDNDGYWDNPFIEIATVKAYKNNINVHKVKVVDAMSYAFHAWGVTNTWFTDTETVLNDGTFYYTGWKYQFTGESKGGGVKRMKFVSKNISPALESFNSVDQLYEDIELVNGTIAMNNSENIKMNKITIRLKPGSRPSWITMGLNTAMVDINQNAGSHHPNGNYVINELHMVQEGPQDGEYFRGLGSYLVPNITITNSSYLRPDAAGKLAGQGFLLWGDNILLDKVKVVGKLPPGYAAWAEGCHIGVRGGPGRGTIKNTCAETIIAMPTIVQENNTTICRK